MTLTLYLPDDMRIHYTTVAGNPLHLLLAIVPVASMKFYANVTVCVSDSSPLTADMTCHQHTMGGKD